MYYQDILHNVQYSKNQVVVLVLGTRDNGITFSSEEAADIFQELSDESIDGLVVAGDEPLSSENLSLLTELCKTCKEDYPEKTIWCHTSLQEDLKDLLIMKYIDEIVPSEGAVLY